MAELLGPNIDYVMGFFMDPGHETVHVETWEQVKHIGGAILTEAVVSMMPTINLDPALTEGLSDLQKLVLANDGPAAYGGQIEDRYTVSVFTPGGDDANAE